MKVLKNLQAVSVVEEEFNHAGVTRVALAPQVGAHQVVGFGLKGVTVTANGLTVGIPIEELVVLAVSAEPGMGAPATPALNVAENVKVTE